MTLWTDSSVSYGDPCDQLSQLTNSVIRAYFELAVAFPESAHFSRSSN